MYHTIQSRRSLIGLGEDIDQATLAGQVRYVKQLYQWERTTLQWLHTQPQSAKIINAQAKMLGLDDALYTPMTQITEADPEHNPHPWPADQGFTWDGYQGTATTPPTLPPDATPLSQDEAEAGLSGMGDYVCYIGAGLLIAAGLVLSLSGIGIPLGLLLIAMGAVWSTGYAYSQSANGYAAIQAAIKAGAQITGDISKKTGDAIFWITIGLAGLWAFSAGRFNSQRGGSSTRATRPTTKSGSRSRSRRRSLR